MVAFSIIATIILIAAVWWLADDDVYEETCNPKENEHDAE